jgi:hypothetical protein
LDYRRAWHRNLSLFESDDREAGKGFEQLAGAKQEIGIARPAEAFVAAREGLVDQHSARRESAGNRREQRAVQVIGNDDAVITIAELPTVVGLEVDPAHRAAWPRKRHECRGIPVDRAHGKSAVAQQANMPASAGRKIEHKATWLDQRQKTLDPDGGGGRGLRRLHALLYIGGGRLQLTGRAGYNGRSEVVAMILFTLRCARGHQFEGWFRDGDGFEAQQKAGAIACPECGETKVEKAVMAPRLGRPPRRLAVGLGVTDDPGGEA